MKDRGKKELEEYTINGDFLEEENPSFLCNKHPSSSSFSGGICPYCLSDRLLQLVCRECGEKNVSGSCCSSGSGTRKISSLIEDEKKGAQLLGSRIFSNPKAELRSPDDNTGDLTNQKISRISELVEISNRERSETKKFWKIGRFFRKKGDHHHYHHHHHHQKINQNHDGVSSRSRSPFSFKGFYYDTARASSVSTENFVLDSAKRSCFSESEARISNFDYYDNGLINGPNKYYNFFSLKESEFISNNNNNNDSGFIDLKLDDNINNLTPSLAALKRNGYGLSIREIGSKSVEVLGNGIFKNGGGSCRVSERELRKCRKNYKVWRWFFRHHAGAGDSH